MIFRRIFMRAGILSSIAALALAGCSPQQQQQPQQMAVQPAAAPVYSSIQECQADVNNPNPNLCAQSFAASQAALPHYGSYSSCQAQGYTDCQDHGGWFGPALAGFMLGSLINGGYHYNPYPVYIGHGGGYYYGSGISMGYRPVRTYYGGSYHYGLPTHTVVVVHSNNYSTVAPTRPGYVAAQPNRQRGGFGSTQGHTMMAQAHSYPSSGGGGTVVSTSRPMGGGFGSSRLSGGGFGGGFHSSGGGFHSSRH